MAQEANSRGPGSIPGRDTSFDVPEPSCLLSGPELQLDSRYSGAQTSRSSRTDSLLNCWKAYKFARRATRNQTAKVIEEKIKDR